MTRQDPIVHLRKHGTEALERIKDAYHERSGEITFVFWDDVPRGDY